MVSIPNGPSALAVKEAAWGLARYAAISQVKIVRMFKQRGCWFIAFLLLFNFFKYKRTIKLIIPFDWFYIKQLLQVEKLIS